VFNCAAILIRLRSPAHGPTDNTNRDAARERNRNALPGDADFEEVVRRELVRARCFFCVACCACKLTSRLPGQSPQCPELR
jgi:hypothetical protein